MRAGQEEIENQRDQTGEKLVTLTTLLQNEITHRGSGVLSEAGGDVFCYLYKYFLKRWH